MDILSLTDLEVGHGRLQRAIFDVSKQISVIK